MAGAIQGQGASGTGRGGGGGGLHFRAPPDVFADAAARTAFFALTANAAVYRQFANDKSLAIIIGTIAAPTGFQTYLGGSAVAYDDAQWIDRTDAVQSITPGPAGIYERSIHRNSSVAIAAAPVGGSINVATGVVTPPADWTYEATAPLAGEDTYRSTVSVNPDTQSGDIVPVWPVPIDIRGEVNVADIDARIAEPARAFKPKGTFDADRIPALIARDVEVTAAVDALKGGVDAAYDTLAELAAAAELAKLATRAEGGAAINLGVVTPTSDRLTAVAPSGYSRYPKGTLLLFKASYGRLDSSWTGNLNFYIGTDQYDLVGDGTSDIRYSDLVADTYYLAVVDTAVQILGPVKRPLDASPTSAGLMSAADKVKLDALIKGGAPAVGAHTRRAAISTDETLEQTEVDAGTTSTSQAITMPTWSGGRRYLYIGVPEDEGDITGVKAGSIDVFVAWERVDGVLFAHKWWKTIATQSDVASGNKYNITEA